MGLISRLILLVTIPFRLARELIQCYVWTPKHDLSRTGSTHADVANGPSNGNSHTNSNANYEVDISKISPDKLARLSQAKEVWWGVGTPLHNLRRMNKVRLPLIIESYIKDVLGREFDSSSLKVPSPLLGARICDVGCGGGYLAEALHKCGAQVVGIDLDHFAVLAGKTHWQEQHGDDEGPQYYNVSVEEFSEQHAGEFDMVVCSELLQNVAVPREVIASSSKLVREGGSLLFTTQNRSVWSLLFSIMWLEHIAAIVPVNTHHLYKFVKPQEIDEVTRRYCFQTARTVGILPIGLTARFKWRLQWVLTSFTGVWFAQIAKNVISQK